MDKPKRGRPRKNPPKIKKKTAKLAEALGRADRIKVSVSPTQKAKLSRLASHHQITESEQVRRLSFALRRGDIEILMRSAGPSVSASLAVFVLILGGFLRGLPRLGLGESMLVPVSGQV